MEVTFKDVLKYLVDKKGLSINGRPRTLVAGGKSSPPDFSERTSINKQLILVVHEIGDFDEIAYNNIEYNTRVNFGLEERLPSYNFDTYDEVVSVLKQLSDHFGEDIDVDEIIHRHRGERRDETVFVLFLPIVEQTYYT